MNIIVRTILNQNGKNIGSVILADINLPVSASQKIEIEQRLKDYAFSTLYSGKTLSVYSDAHSDSACITVIREVDDLPEMTITI